MKNEMFELDHIFKDLTPDTTGLFLDFDGTISRIDSSPTERKISKKALNMVNILSTKLRLVTILSGRRSEDIYQRMLLDRLIYIGNHGGEYIERGRLYMSPNSVSQKCKIDKLFEKLRALADSKGVIWENKELSGSVHFREAKNPSLAGKKLSEALKSTNTHGLETYWGKMVLEVRSPGNPNKGNAIEHFVSKYELKHVLFLGDDMTDLDGMIAIQKIRNNTVLKTFGIVVLDQNTPEKLLESGDYIIEGVDQVEELLLRMTTKFL